ncbi:hypothetical protein [Paramicrobacterium agarici]|uniref:hypothetical protein n=1 Tax=Paramicrobacterium agarici TaxID=630514 RepID=UPI0011547C1D|nr:hypothetical protein [Microbacterium agarici]TQO23703.1 hypothetical protein FB385_2561 [Microbacterium agarici]
MNSRKNDLEIEVITSRRALIDVIRGLADHREALTVLGGHAVIEVTQNVPSVPPDDVTHDGDLGVTPELLSDDPKLSERMSALGYETARPERPGVWSPISQRDRGIYVRDSVDLIAPMSLARGDLTSARTIRSARVGAHGKRAVSATRGTELSIIDRSLMTLRSFDEGPAVDAYVAGPAALLCAKAYKIYDRLDPAELQRNADRLRPKDYADVYRLLLAIAPEDAAAEFSRGTADERIAEAVVLGQRWLVMVLQDAPNAAAMIADAWGDPDRETGFRSQIEEWRRRFVAQTEDV